MFTLRFVLLKNGCSLTEWPPTGTTLAQARREWSSVNIAIAPHGAGLTNMLFMPQGSTIIEIIAEGQTGRVYGTLAQTLGHTYVGCYYNRTEPAVLTMARRWARDQSRQRIRNNTTGT